MKRSVYNLLQRPPQWRLGYWASYGLAEVVVTSMWEGRFGLSLPRVRTQGSCRYTPLICGVVPQILNMIPRSLRLPSTSTPRTVVILQAFGDSATAAEDAGLHLASSLHTRAVLVPTMYACGMYARRGLSKLIRRNVAASSAATATASGERSGGVSAEEISLSKFTAAVAAVAALAFLVTDSSNDGGARDNVAHCKGDKMVWLDSYGKKVAVREKHPNGAAEEPLTAEASRSNRYYPYVIIGYGIAGQAALRALLERDPCAHVLVIDARLDGAPPPPASELPKTSRVEFARGVRATGLDADRGLLFMSDNTLAGSSTGTLPLVVGSAGRPEEDIAFGRCLLALGTRPRSPPDGYVDPSMWSDMALLGWRDKDTRKGLRRDVEAGKAVTILGSSWEALQLACELEERRALSEKGPEGQCRMMFSDYAPMDHILPRYLSTALLRRLNKRNIKTHGLTSLRWLGPRRGQNSRSATSAQAAPAELPAVAPVDSAPEIDVATAGLKNVPSTSDQTILSQSVVSTRTGEESVASVNSGSERGSPSVEYGDDANTKWTMTPRQLQEQQKIIRKLRRRPMHVSVCKTFDHLETSSHTADRVVLAGLDPAPVSSVLDILGEARRRSRGEGGQEDEAPIRRKKVGLSALEVDERRGAIVVNSELAASSRVWAAGDVACFPSHAHGGKRMVLRTADHAHHSGLVAGNNMAASALDAGHASARGSARVGAHGDGGSRRYTHSPAFIGDAPLAGVRVAMVGDCSAAFTTHGFWWTNRATGLTSSATNPIKGRGNGAVKAPTGATLRSRKTAKKLFSPVFGTGVVFYTDGSEVKGAMLWGFPGAAAAAAATRHRRKRILAKNGGEMPVTDENSPPDMEESPEDVAAGLTLRALDLLRLVMTRSLTMDADLTDERVMVAWTQGLSDAAQIVAQETGVGHLPPFRRTVPGRDTSNTRRPAGSQDELLYQDPSRTVSMPSQLEAAFQSAAMTGTAAHLRGSSLYGYYGASRQYKEHVQLVEFLGDEEDEKGSIEEEQVDDVGSEDDQ